MAAAAEEPLIHSARGGLIPFPGNESNFFFLIYLFLAALGLRCCVRAFSSGGEQGLLFLVVRRLPIAVASLVAEHRL